MDNEYPRRALRSLVPEQIFPTQMREHRLSDFSFNLRAGGDETGQRESVVRFS